MVALKRLRRNGSVRSLWYPSLQKHRHREARRIRYSRMYCTGPSHAKLRFFVAAHPHSMTNVSHCCQIDNVGLVLPQHHVSEPAEEQRDRRSRLRLHGSPWPKMDGHEQICDEQMSAAVKMTAPVNARFRYRTTTSCAIPPSH